MSDSIFNAHVMEPLSEIVNDFKLFLPIDIIFQGNMYVYQKDKSPLAQRKHVILTRKGLFIINSKKVSNETHSLYVSIKINITWSKLYFFANKMMDVNRVYAFPFQISIILNLHVANFYMMNDVAFNQWKNVLEKVGVQTNFVDKYLLGEKIGKGASASVHKITNIQTGNEYACKVFKKYELKNDRLNLKGLINEIKILKDIRGHPNLVHLEEIHETEESVYIVTELIEGAKIFQKTIKYECHEICNLIESLLSALVFLKDKGIIHRDIKPDNLLLKYKSKPLNLNEIKIIDFGLATYFDSKEHIYNHCGTIGYVAPEILNSIEYDVNFTPAVDIYSFGIVVYNFVSGTKAFRDESSNDVYRNNKRGKVNLSAKKFVRASPHR